MELCIKTTCSPKEMHNYSEKFAPRVTTFSHVLHHHRSNIPPQIESHGKQKQSRCIKNGYPAAAWSSSVVMIGERATIFERELIPLQRHDHARFCILRSSLEPEDQPVAFEAWPRAFVYSPTVSFTRRYLSNRIECVSTCMGIQVHCRVGSGDSFPPTKEKEENYSSEN